ncbi:hypothetical protein B0H12DRAFT_406304 [Mycena haematopus]|nr:hypothetical protein B0H12DRAFT_406304 [Mycena haematopus]
MLWIYRLSQWTRTTMGTLARALGLSLEDVDLALEVVVIRSDEDGVVEVPAPLPSPGRTRGVRTRLAALETIFMNEGVDDALGGCVGAHMDDRPQRDTIQHGLHDELPACCGYHHRISLHPRSRARNEQTTPAARRGRHRRWRVHDSHPASTRPRHGPVHRRRPTPTDSRGTADPTHPLSAPWNHK